MHEFDFYITDCSHLTNDDLFDAAKLGNKQKMEIILECNVTDLNSIDIDGQTPLYLAAENNHEDLVRLLLMQRGIDVNKGIESGEMAGSSPLFVAAHLNLTKIVRLLIDHPDIDTNKGRNSDGRTPLLNSALFGYTKVVKLLLAYQEIDVNKGVESVEWAGVTPLYAASQNGHEEVI